MPLNALADLPALAQRYLTVAHARQVAAYLYEVAKEEVQAHPLHIVVEVGFVLALIFMVLTPRKHHVARDETLTPEEEQELISQFKSAGFHVPALPDPDWEAPLISRVEDRHRVNLSYAGATYDGVVNNANFDLLGLAVSPKLIDTAADTTVEYGVGSCGPRGFYGTLKPHLALEEALAKFMRAPTAIIYSCSFASPSTVLPCFAARGDELLCDELCTIQAQQGASLSRASTVYYRHLDLKHVEELMKQSHERQRKKGLPLMRRWLVTEGLFRNTGEIAPVDKLVALAKKYKYRVCLDDNTAFGAIGATGRGTPELFGVSLADVDIYLGSTAMAIGSVGGFCVGSEMVTDHQRLGATGYVFSAAACAYSSTCATLAVQLLGDSTSEESARPARVQAHGKRFRALVKAPAGIVLLGAGCAQTSQHSPVVHFRRAADLATLDALKAERAAAAAAAAANKKGGGPAAAAAVLRKRIPAPASFDEASSAFLRVHDAVLKRGYLVCRVEFNHEEHQPVPPSLRVNLKSEMTEKEVAELAAIVSEELQREFGGKK